MFAGHVTTWELSHLTDVYAVTVLEAGRPGAGVNRDDCSRGLASGFADGSFLDVFSYGFASVPIAVASPPLLKRPYRIIALLTEESLL